MAGPACLLAVIGLVTTQMAELVMDDGDVGEDVHERMENGNLWL
eukprot:COSAG01_NODE_1164_length_11447_cov_19.221096_5_plen_44_part_00